MVRSSFFVKFRFLWLALLLGPLPLLLRYLLHAALPVYLLFLLPVIKLLLELPRVLKRWPQLQRFSRILSGSYSVILASFILLCIVITPYSVFAYFFEAASTAAAIPAPLEESYFVASLFVLLFCFFTQFFTTAMLRQRSVVPLTGLPFAFCGVLLIILQKPLFLLLFIFSGVLFTLLTLRRRIRFLAGALLGCTLCALLLYNMNPEPAGSRLVDKVIFPRTRHWINNTFPRLPLLLDIPGYGIGLGSGKLGGSTLLTSLPVLEVSGDPHETIYLQTNCYDLYRDNSWQHSFTLGNELKPATRTELFQPGTQLLEIEILSEVFPMLPFTRDSRGFRLGDEYYRIAQQTAWPGILIGDTLRKHSRLTLYRSRLTPQPLADPSPYLDTSGIPESVKELAQELGSGATGPLDVMRRIHAFLAENYTYNLQAPELDTGEDFLETFLFKERWGYCTHFATAFTILARLNGIPARYVTGYLVYFTEGESTRTVTARSAHAWTEVWLPETGWQTQEATQAVSRDYYENQPEQFLAYLQRYLMREEGIAHNALTLEQLQELLGIEFTYSVKQPVTTALWERLRAPLYWTGGLLLLGLFSTGGYLVVRRLSKQREPVKFALNRLVRDFKLAGPPEKQGWQAWQRVVCHRYNLPPDQAARLLVVVLRLAYSSHSPTHEELDFLKRVGRINRPHKSA